jgi:hypothetical protein
LKKFKNLDSHDKQLDISDDGFLSLMTDDGETKDDVKMPDGEVGEKIQKLFVTEEKDTSMTRPCSKLALERIYGLITSQTSLFLPPWASSPLLRPRRLPSLVKISAP